MVINVISLSTSLETFDFSYRGRSSAKSGTEIMTISVSLEVTSNVIETVSEVRPLGSELEVEGAEVRTKPNGY